ncbi:MULTISPECIES: TolC family outer membrane protein [Methylomonas]|uniref:Channel protein TolC n=2 Tax=Methylomonas TaxID=416 RepID=A0A140E735_9GAMM|nr:MULTISPECIES: TolC family outer membrane protein [Methylomonas]AMK79209.1 channel protein TolC [Methylomonas denitrificans]OAH98161.1 channel protein TolC [Methylomonas methanica]TCV86272.1 outer membrane protein [Methylomonas methanica]
MTKLLPTFFVALTWGSPAFCQDLLETYQLAKANDPEFKSSDINKLATAEIKSQSIAQMLPNISFNANSSRNRLESTSFLGTTLQHYWDHKLGFNLKQPVFHWDHWVQLDQADNKIAQAEAQFQAKQQSLIRRTAEAYFNILAAQDNLEFADSEKKSIEKQLEQAKQRFDVGIIAITDVYEAQAGYDRALASEIEAQNQLDNSKEALREIIGENAADLNSLQPQIPLSPPAPEDLSSWSNAAENNNFSIVAQLNQAEYVRKNVELQQSKHLPTLDIVAQYGDQDTGNRYGLRGDNESVGLQLNLPLFEGGGTSSRSRQAAYEYEAAKEDLTKVKRSINRGVKDAFRGVVSSISRVKALDATSKSAEMAVEAAEAGFEVGTRTMVDVLTEQRNLYKAKSDYARSRYDYLINGIKLKEAAGSLNEQDLEQINQYLQGTLSKN